MDVPEDRSIKIVAIQAEDVQTWGEKLTPRVERAIPRAVETVLALMEEENEPTLAFPFDEGLGVA
jgi:Ni,Fe-hydrogenase maturation factor